MIIEQTRRQFFQNCGIGVGKVALASMLADGALAKGKHHEAKVDSVIYLFMAGGPSQLELFDYKPKLKELDGQPIPTRSSKGKRFAFMDTFAKEPPKLLGTRRKFAQHGQGGHWVSELPAAHRRRRRRHRRRQRRWPLRTSTTARRSCSSTPARPSSAGRAWARG